MNPTYTFKDIARKTGVSVDVVRYNEKRWGLNSCRINVSRKTVLFRQAPADKILRALGFSV